MARAPSVGPVCVVVRVSRDGVRVLGDRVAVVTVLEEPVSCAAGGGIAAEGGETPREVDKRMGWTLYTLATPQTPRRGMAEREKRRNVRENRVGKGMGWGQLLLRRKLFLPPQKRRGTPGAQL